MWPGCHGSGLGAQQDSGGSGYRVQGSAALRLSSTRTRGAQGSGLSSTPGVLGTGLRTRGHDPVGAPCVDRGRPATATSAGDLAGRGAGGRGGEVPEPPGLPPPMGVGRDGLLACTVAEAGGGGRAPSPILSEGAGGSTFAWPVPVGCCCCCCCRRAQQAPAPAAAAAAEGVGSSQPACCCCPGALHAGGRQPTAATPGPGSARRRLAGQPDQDDWVRAWR